MPKGIPYASGNIVAGTGKELNYIGSHCFAFSGVVSVDNNKANLLSFTTGKEYIEAWIQLYASTTQADDFEVEILVNDLAIISSEYEKSYSGQFVNGIPRRVIIPPFTKVDVTAQNTQGSTNADWSTTFTGKLYT